MKYIVFEYIGKKKFSDLMLNKYAILITKGIREARKYLYENYDKNRKSWKLTSIGEIIGPRGKIAFLIDGQVLTDVHWDERDTTLQAFI